MRKLCIHCNCLYQVTEKLMCSPTNVVHMMGRFGGIPKNIQQLFCVLISYTFYDVVSKMLPTVFADLIKRYYNHKKIKVL